MTKDLKIKKGSLAEYLIPQRPEYAVLHGVRSKIFHADNMQDLLDYVQDEIVKIEKKELIPLEEI